MTKFKTQWNAAAFPKQIEKPTGVSNTVPNQSLTIQEIYRRYASGRPLTGVKTPIFDDDGEGHELGFDDFLPDMSKMDLADRQALLEAAKEHMDDVKRRLNATAEARKRQKEEKEKEQEKRLKALEAGKQTEMDLDPTTKDKPLK